MFSPPRQETNRTIPIFRGTIIELWGDNYSKRPFWGPSGNNYCQIGRNALDFHHRVGKERLSVEMSLGTGILRVCRKVLDAHL